ncbi:MAG: helix-turn-helix transcriptional regulator [Lachnospiraceae bacterium]|nr:helix-turn-helix transcriptional regulator [Lachnospiraceae bacterium]
MDIINEKKEWSEISHKKGEKIASGGDFVGFHKERSYLQTNSYALHCHSRYEIYYFIDGQVSYLVEGRKYVPTPHSVLLLAPNVFHGVRIESDSGYERMSVHFDSSTVLNENASLLLAPFSGGSNDIYFENVDSFGLDRYFEDICACASMDEDLRNAAVHLRTQNLLVEIVRLSRKRQGSTAGYDNAAVKQMIQYLNQHLTEDLNLDNLSRQFYISKYYLNTLFKKATGTTVMNYVIHKRVALAKQMMLQGTSPARASEAAGFQDYSSFFRAYKKIYGKAPSQI